MHSIFDETHKEHEEGNHDEENHDQDKEATANKEKRDKQKENLEALGSIKDMRGIIQVGET